MSEVTKLEARELMDAIDTHFPNASRNFYKALEAEILRQHREDPGRTLAKIAETLDENLYWHSGNLDHPTIKPTPELAALLPQHHAHLREQVEAGNPYSSNDWHSRVCSAARRYLGR